MEKEILEEIKEILLSQQEKSEELDKKTYEIYKIVWSHIIDIMNEDVYGKTLEYSLNIVCSKNNITDKITINKENYNLPVNVSLLVKLLREDGFTMYGSKEEESIIYEPSIARCKLLNLLKKKENNNVRSI